MSSGRTLALIRSYYIFSCWSAGSSRRMEGIMASLQGNQFVSHLFLSVFVRMPLGYKARMHTCVSPLPFVSPPPSKPGKTAHRSYSPQRPQVNLSCPSLKTITGPLRLRGVTPSTSGEPTSVYFPLTFLSWIGSSSSAWPCAGYLSRLLRRSQLRSHGIAT
jgi:hypothetical protein